MGFFSCPRVFQKGIREFCRAHTSQDAKIRTAVDGPGSTSGDVPVGQHGGLPREDKERREGPYGEQEPVTKKVGRLLTHGLLALVGPWRTSKFPAYGKAISIPSFVPAGSGSP